MVLSPREARAFPRAWFWLWGLGPEAPFGQRLLGPVKTYARVVETICNGLLGTWWRKGQIPKDLGQKDEARQAADKALKIDSGHQGARNLKEDLKK